MSAQTPIASVPPVTGERHVGSGIAQPQAGQPMPHPWAIGECKDSTGDTWRVDRGTHASRCRMKKVSHRVLRITGDFPAGLARFDLIGRKNGFDTDSLFIRCRFTLGTGPNAIDPNAPLTGPWDYINGDFVVPRFGLRVNGLTHPESVWVELPGIDDLAHRRVRASFALLFESDGAQCIELDFGRPKASDARLDASSFTRIEIGRDERDANRTAEPPALLPGLKGVHPRMWITPERVEALRREIRSDGSRHKAWQKVVSKRRTDVRSSALRYLLEDGADALVTAMAEGDALVARKHWGTEWPGHMGCDNDIHAGESLFCLATLCDWLDHALDNDRRTRWQSCLIHHARQVYRFALLQRGYLPTGYLQNHFSGTYHGLGAAGLLLCDHHDAAIASEARSWLSLVTYEFDRRNALFATDGSGHALDVSYGMRFFTYFAEALRTATGHSLYGGSFMRNLWRYWWHSKLAISGTSYYRGTLWFVGRVTRNAEALAWFRSQAAATESMSIEEFLCCDGEPGEPGEVALPTESVGVFPEAGEAYAHGASGATALIFAGVPCGRRHQPLLTRYNHAHYSPSQGEVRFWYRGEAVLDLAGRSYRKQTAHYNTLTVDGAGQYGDRFVWMPQLNEDRCGALLSARASPDDGSFRATSRLENAYPFERGIASYRREVWFHQGDIPLLAILDRVTLSKCGASRKLEWHFHNARVEELDEDGTTSCVSIGHAGAPFLLTRITAQPGNWNREVAETPIVVQYTHKGGVNRRVTWSRDAMPGETVAVAYLLQPAWTEDRAALQWAAPSNVVIDRCGMKWHVADASQ